MSESVPVVKKIWNSVRPSQPDPSETLQLVYRDDEDFFAWPLGIDSSWLKPRLQSRYIAFLVIPMLFVMSLLAFVTKNSTIYFAYMHFMVFTIILLELLFALGMNREALKRVVKSFEFWFKIYEGLIFQVYFCLNDYHLNPNYDWLGRIEWTIETCILICLIGALDASSLGPNLKWMMTAVMAAAFTACTVTYRFGWFGYGEHIVTVYGHEIATLDKVVSASQVLAIFYWKQTLALFRGGPTGRSASLAYSPYIKWIMHGEDETENTGDHKGGDIETGDGKGHQETQNENGSYGTDQQTVTV